MHPRGHRKRGQPRKAKKETMKKEEGDTVIYEALQAKVKDLEEENKRLSALLSRNSHPSCSSAASSSVPSSTFSPPVVTVKRKKPTKSKSCSPQRRIVLLVACLGQDPFQGCQGRKAGSPLRLALLHALKTTSLVENISFCDLQGCSSNKEEISETGQHPIEVMVAVTVQSRVRKAHFTHASKMKMEAKDIIDPEDDSEEDLSQEVNYPAVLNEALPTEIRVLAWCSVLSDFVLPASTSLNTLHTYKYFFPQGSLNVEVMNTAAQQMVGRHVVPSHHREIVRISVSEYEPDRGPHQDPEAPREESSYMHPQDELPKVTKGHPSRSSQDTSALLQSARYKMCVLTVTGRGFTWMDIRKVALALLSVGKAKEDEGGQLFSMEAILRGHELGPADETSVHLFHTKLQEEWQWVWDRQALTSVVIQLQQYWAQHAVRATAARAFLQGYEAVLAGVLGTVGIPQAQCQNIAGQEAVDHSCSSSSVPSDHEYSAVMEKGGTQGSCEQGGSYSPSLVPLLVQLVGPLVCQLMGNDRSQETALLRLHGQIVRCGVPSSLATVTQAWKDLLVSYGKARHQWLAGEQVEWEHFKVLDSLLCGYDLPSSEGSPSQPCPTTSPTIDATTKSLWPKNPNEEEEDGERDEAEEKNQEQELEVEDDENEMVLLVEPSSLALSHKESLFLKEAHESFMSSPSSIGKSSEMEDFIVKSETHSLPSPVSPCPFSLLMTEEVEENKMHIKNSSRRRKQERTVQLKRISSSKEMRDEEEEEEEDRQHKVKKEKLTNQFSSKLFLHHEKDAVFAIEMGHQHTTNPTDIFLEYQLHRSHQRKENMRECLSYLVKKNTQREEYRRRKEQVEEETLTALKEVDVGCHDLKTRLMEV